MYLNLYTLLTVYTSYIVGQVGKRTTQADVGIGLARNGWVSSWRRIGGTAVPQLPEMGTGVALEVTLAWPAKKLTARARGRGASCPCWEISSNQTRPLLRHAGRGARDRTGAGLAVSHSRFSFSFPCSIFGVIGCHLP